MTIILALFPMIIWSLIAGVILWKAQPFSKENAWNRHP